MTIVSVMSLSLKIKKRDQGVKEVPRDCKSEERRTQKEAQSILHLDVNTVRTMINF